MCDRRGPVVAYVYDRELGRIGWLKKAIFLFSSAGKYFTFTFSFVSSFVWRLENNLFCIHVRYRPVYVNMIQKAIIVRHAEIYRLIWQFESSKRTWFLSYCVGRCGER